MCSITLRQSFVSRTRGRSEQIILTSLHWLHTSLIAAKFHCSAGQFVINGLLMNLYLLIFNFGLNLFTQIWGKRISCLHNTAPHVKQSWLCFTFLYSSFCFVLFFFLSFLFGLSFLIRQCKVFSRKVRKWQGSDTKGKNYSRRPVGFSVILMKSLNRNESQSVSLWVRVIWRVSWTIIYHASSAWSAREKVIFFTYLSK